MVNDIKCFVVGIKQGSLCIIIDSFKVKKKRHESFDVCDGIDLVRRRVSDVGYGGFRWATTVVVGLG